MISKLLTRDEIDKHFKRNGYTVGLWDDYTDDQIEIFDTLGIEPEIKEVILDKSALRMMRAIITTISSDVCIGNCVNPALALMYNIQEISDKDGVYLISSNSTKFDVLINTRRMIAVIWRKQDYTLRQTKHTGIIGVIQSLFKCSKYSLVSNIDSIYAYLFEDHTIGKIKNNFKKIRWSFYSNLESYDIDLSHL